MQHTTFDLALKLTDIAILLIWGAFEFVSISRIRRKYSIKKTANQGSLSFIYIASSIGCALGVPIAFSKYGKIDFGFPFISILGLVLIGSGLLIRSIAKKTLESQFSYEVSIINKHKLVTTGLYKYIQHPLYLGYLLVYLGIGIVFLNWASIFLFFVPNFISILYRIFIEKKFLIENFGNQYLEYAKKTKLFIPWLI
jgi:protein-S-isoprenylcysteine O-methyltransferase Ste14